MRQADPESLPNRESTAKRRLFGYDCKHNSRWHLNIDKFLLSRIGRKWSNVYSELCKKKDKFVAADDSIDRLIKYSVKVDFSNKLEHYQDFFVDESGILQKVKKVSYKKRQKTPSVDYLVIDGETYGLRSDGMWYHLLFKPIPEPKYVWVYKPYSFGTLKKTFFSRVNVSDKVFDVWLLEYYCEPQHSKWKNGRYCYKYNQVSKKVLKKIKKVLGELYESQNK